MKFIKPLTLLLLIQSLLCSHLEVLGSERSNNQGVTISVDFTNDSTTACELYNVWSVANRISPENGVSVADELSVNLIRMIGGIIKDKKSKAPYEKYDVVSYNTVTESYEYDFTELFNRMDKVVFSSTPIHQLVIDQPDWAFQQGYKYIANDSLNGINFREREKTSAYGNALPPSDKEAYANYIVELMRQLVGRYGEQRVLSWQLRIGSEIETPDHWFGSEQDFIDHYINVTNAIRKVLPEAKIGPHTRTYDFKYLRDKNYSDYRGLPRASFASNLLRACREQGVKIDFWGVSNYVVVNNSRSRDIPNTYKDIYEPFINDPNWDENIVLDLMEYSAIVTMFSQEGAGFINCSTPHGDLVDVVLTHQFYKYHDKGLRHIYRWGNRAEDSERNHIQVINSMNGMISYTTTIEGTAQIKGNSIDAIVAKEDDKIELLLYNYNALNYDYQQDEKVKISLVVDKKAGTKFHYQILSSDKGNNTLEQFYLKYGEKYLKKGFDKRGSASSVLNEEGQRLYKEFEAPAPHDISEVYKTTTVASKDGKSTIELEVDLPSFSYSKIEIWCE